MTIPRNNIDEGDSQGDGSTPLDPKVQNKLGAMLKQHYDDLVAAPVPDQFLVLLAELEAKERSLDN